MNRDYVLKDKPDICVQPYLLSLGRQKLLSSSSLYSPKHIAESCSRCLLVVYGSKRNFSLHRVSRLLSLEGIDFTCNILYRARLPKNITLAYSFSKPLRCRSFKQFCILRGERFEDVNKLLQKELFPHTHYTSQFEALLKLGQ